MFISPYKRPSVRRAYRRRYVGQKFRRLVMKARIKRVGPYSMRSKLRSMRYPARRLRNIGTGRYTRRY